MEMSKRRKISMEPAIKAIVRLVGLHDIDRRGKIKLLKGDP